MRILNFGEREVKIDFSEPKTVELLEAKIHKSIMDLIISSPKIRDIASMLECGSCGDIKSKDECYELFKEYESGAYGLLKELAEELGDAGWIGVAKEQLKDKTGKN